MKKIVDQRKHKRFKVQEDVFVAFRSHLAKLGNIVDISMGGLGFRYLADEYESDGVVELYIFSASRDFYMDKVPFKMISDFEMVNDVPFSSVIMKRSGIQFGELTDRQISRLEYFIQNHTTGELQVNQGGRRDQACS
ncbi:MAG: PilZ domain-containing protein [Desulfobacterales bacterium]|nr:PilZ domain-containing protein [Desulfobacterales bacterium]